MEAHPRVDYSIRVLPAWEMEDSLPGPDRWRWTHTPGVIVAASAMITFALAFAAEPWNPRCSPISAFPFLFATIALLLASDLMLKPKPPWVRFRDRGVMNAGLLAIGATLVLSVLTSSSLAWPVLYPLFILPMALPVVVMLGLGTISHIRMSDETWRLIIVWSLVAAAASIAVGLNSYQSHIACRWT